MAEFDTRDNSAADSLSNEAPAKATERLIERFGGIRPMAAKLEIPVTTVQGWKKRGAIPASRHGDILAAAEKHGIVMEIIDIAATEPSAEIEPEIAASAQKSQAFNNPVLWIALAISAFVLVAVLLSFIGLYIVKQKTADLSHRINMLEQTTGGIATLNDRVTALEKSVHGPGADLASQAAISDLQKHMGTTAGDMTQVAILAQKVQELQATSGNHDVLGQTVSGLQQTVASMQGTLQTLSQSLEATKLHVGEIDTAMNEKRAENARQFAILLAINQLRSIASTSQPFETEITSARLMAHDDADIMKQLEVLAPYASDGAPTLNELRAEFSDLASEIVRSNVVGSGKSWFRQALYRLGSVVSIRKIGSKAATGTNPENLVAHAESDLEEDDLAGAVAALNGLTGLSKDVAAAWVDAANRRLSVDTALTALSELTIQRLSSLQTVPGGKP